MSTGFSLTKYDEMCRAIEASYQVDEVAEIRDRALAIELYMKQQRNTEPERRACEIRLRAERKLGALAKEMERSQGKRTDLRTSSLSGAKSLREQLEEHGISKRQAEKWQKMAEIPDDQFEAALADPERKPTTSGIIGERRKEVPVEDDALWLWGRLLDFERRGLFSRRFEDVCRTMVPHMRETVRELAPKVSLWLDGA